VRKKQDGTRAARPSAGPAAPLRGSWPVVAGAYLPAGVAGAAGAAGAAGVAFAGLPASAEAALFPALSAFAFAFFLCFFLAGFASGLVSDVFVSGVAAGAALAGAGAGAGAAGAAGVPEVCASAAPAANNPEIKMASSFFIVFPMGDEQQ